MTTLAEIEAAALALPQREFDELRDRLDKIQRRTASGDTGSEDDLQSRVRAAEDRLDAYKRGEMDSYSHEEVMQHIDARLEAIGPECEAADGQIHAA